MNADESIPILEAQSATSARSFGVARNLMNSVIFVEREIVLDIVFIFWSGYYVVIKNYPPSGLLSCLMESCCCLEIVFCL